MTTTPTDTDATTETNEWQFPIEAVLEYHKARIAGNEDHVPAMVEAWVEGEGPVWSAMVADVGESSPRDCALFAASIMSRITGADYILFCVDTHMSHSQVNPTTGKPWAPGEMQRMCDEEGYCDTGNIRDNLMVAIVRRSDAKIYMTGIPYHFHKGEVMYFDPQPPMDEWNDEGGVKQMGGTIPDTLRQVIQQPPLSEQLTQMGAYEAIGFDGPSNITRLHQILAGIRVMGKVAVDTGCEGPMFLHMIPTSTDEERQIMDDFSKRDDITNLAEYGAEEPEPSLAEQMGAAPTTIEEEPGDEPAQP